MKWYNWVIIIGVIMLIVWYNRDTISQKTEELATKLLSAEQEMFISKLHSKAQPVFRKFIAEVQGTGYRIIVTSGYRSFSEQQNLFNQNAQNARPGYSTHNYGLAIDINAAKGNQWLRKSSTKQDWISSGIPAIAKKHGLFWGGDFANYHDPVHFHLTGYDTAKLLATATKQFGNNPANIIGNQVNLTA